MLKLQLHRQIMPSRACNVVSERQEAKSLQTVKEVIQFYQHVFQVFVLQLLLCCYAIWSRPDRHEVTKGEHETMF